MTHSASSPTSSSMSFVAVMPSGGPPHSSPTSRPALSRLWTQHPTSSSSGWASTPAMAARPTPPVAHWMTRMATGLLLSARRHRRPMPRRPAPPPTEATTAGATADRCRGRATADDATTAGATADRCHDGTVPPRPTVSRCVPVHPGASRWNRGVATGPRGAGLFERSGVHAGAAARHCWRRRPGRSATRRRPRNRSTASDPHRCGASAASGGRNP